MISLLCYIRQHEIMNITQKTVFVRVIVLCKINMLYVYILNLY